MAGPNPGMVVKVAADLTAFEQSLATASADADRMAAEVSAASASAAGGQVAMTNAVAATTRAYDDLGDAAPDDLHAVEEATEDVDKATGGLQTTMIAFGTFVGTLAADLAGAVFKQVGKAIEALGEALYEITGAKTIVEEAWAGIKAELTAAFDASGVVTTALKTMGQEFLTAFGVTKQEAIANIVKWINQAAIAGLDFAAEFAEAGHGIGRVVAAINGPLIVLSEGFITLVERVNAGVASVTGLAAQMPGVGEAFKGMAAQAKEDAAAWAGYREAASSARLANDELLRGVGPVHTALDTTATVLRKARDAAREANETTGASVDAFLRAGNSMTTYVGVVEGTGIPAIETLKSDMDAFALSIKNMPPLTGLGDIERQVTPLSDSLKGLDLNLQAVRTDARFMEETIEEEMLPALEEATKATDRAAASTLSWSQAMDAVRRGEGTMGGQISAPGNVLQGKPPSVWAGIAAGMGGVVRWDDYGNPYVDTTGGLQGSAAPTYSSPQLLEQRYGIWGASAAVMAPFMGSGGSNVNQSVTVNTVMGDKYEIARLVKEALADDWRAMGQRA